MVKIVLLAFALLAHGVQGLNVFAGGYAGSKRASQAVKQTKQTAPADASGQTLEGILGAEEAMLKAARSGRAASLMVKDSLQDFIFQHDMLAGDDSKLFPANSSMNFKEKDTQKDSQNATVSHATVSEASQESVLEADRLGIKFPSELRNKNLVFIGDSVDRQATHRMCAIFGETIGPAKLLGKTMDFIGGYGQHVCHLPKYNSTILFRAHAGAMRVFNEPNWAKISEDYYWSGRNPVLDGHLKIEPMWRQKEEWTIKNMLDELPARPAFFVVQSSLWDSVHAAEFLYRSNLPYSFKQDTNNWQWQQAVKKAKTDGRGWKANMDSIAAWDWDQKATELVSMVRGSGVPWDHVIWRTNANCPPDQDAYEGYNVGRDYNNFIDRVHSEMADVARGKVASQEGPWKDTVLMDWRGALDARKEGWCNGVHYEPPAYDNYIRTYFSTAKKAYGSE